MEVIKVQVLVVGSGNGGMTAALSTSILGCDDVLIIEKATCYGGTSAMSGGGVWIPCNRYAMAAGASDSLDDAYRYLRAVVPSADTSDEDLKNYLKNGPEMVDFLHRNSDVNYASLSAYPDYFSFADGAKHGHRSMEPVPISVAELADFFSEQQSPNPMIKLLKRLFFTQEELHYLMGRLPGWKRIVVKNLLKYAFDIPMRLRGKQSRLLTMGAAGIARLRLSLHKRKIPVWLNTSFTDLIYENGRIVGALVEKEGEICRIEASRGVVLAAGGFEHNQKLRDQYLPPNTQSQWSAGSRNNTGDALLAAKRVGAATRLLDKAWWSTTISVPGEAYPRLSIFEKSLPGNYVFDSNGSRVANESQNYMIFMQQLLKRYGDGESKGPFFMIFDSTYRKKFAAGPLLPGEFWPDFLIPKSYFESGFLSKADSLEALAEKIGIDTAKMVASINRINIFAKVGKDEDFQRGESEYDRYYSDPSVKPNPCLAPVSTGPFYAMKIDPGDFGTLGGLKTDHHARVISEKNIPIPGLYAIGNCAAGILTSYPGPGATLGPAMVGGYMAAKHMFGATQGEG